jgi:hypothetical protein
MYEHEICKPWTADWKVCVCNIKQDIFSIWKCWKYRGYFVEISVNIIFEIKVILEIFYLSFDKFGHKACRTSVLVRAPVTMQIRVVTSFHFGFRIHASLILAWSSHIAHNLLFTHWNLILGITSLLGWVTIMSNS